MNLNRTIPLLFAVYAVVSFRTVEARDACAHCSTRSGGGVLKAPCSACVNVATPVLGAQSELGLGIPVAACSDSFCGYECRSEGLVFAIEAVWIDVFQRDGTDIASGLIPLQNPDASAIGELDPGFEPSLRIALGWQSDSSWAIRARYWEFDTFASQTVPVVMPDMPDMPDLAIHIWNINMLDVEFAYSAMTFHHWDTTLSAGYRLVVYEEGGTLLRGSTDLASARTRFIGNGISGAAEARRHLRPGLVGLANTRLSLFGGNEEFTVTGITPSPSTAGRDQADARFIYEAQLAAEVIRPICGGGYYFLRGGVEVQYWDEFVAPLRRTDRSYVLFGGLVFAVGLQR